MRKLAIIVLSFGVIGGFSSGFAAMRRMHHGGCGYSEEGRWVPGHWESQAERAALAPAPVAAPAPAPVAPPTYVMPQMQPPQIIVVQPQAAPAAPPTIVFQPSAPAAAPVSPKTETAKPPITE